MTWAVHDVKFQLMLSDPCAKNDDEEIVLTSCSG